MFEDWSPEARTRKVFEPDFCLDKKNSALSSVFFGQKHAQFRSYHALFFAAFTLVITTLSWSQFLLLDMEATFRAEGPHRRLQDLKHFHQAFNASNLQSLEHLIMVAGHAVVMSESLDHIDQAEDDWYLEDYQRGQDIPSALVDHIRGGVKAAAKDPKSLLVFSGGQTRPSAGPRDEGSSYYRVAEHYNWWGHGTVPEKLLDEESTQQVAVPQRTVTEDFALDSFQNLMFSLCRFKEVVGKYPSKVTVISFGFKQTRFADLHRRAVRFPAEQFFFIGIQPPPGSHFDLKKARTGELENSLRLFQADPYGCHTSILVKKREARNPFHRTTPYALSCGEMQGLLKWCGPEIFSEPLPWAT